MAAPNAPVGTVINSRPAESVPEFATRYTNLAHPDFGAKVLFCSAATVRISSSMVSLKDKVVSLLQSGS